MRNQFRYIISSIMLFAAQWTVSFFILKKYGLETTGYYSSALSLTGIFLMISTFGIRTIQATDSKYEFTNDDYIYLRIISQFFSIIAFIAYLFISKNEKEFLTLLIVLFIFRGVEAFTDLFLGFQQRDNNFASITFSNLIRSISYIILVIIASIFRVSFNSWLIVYTILNLIELLFIDLNLKRKNSTTKGLSKQRVFKLGKSGFFNLAASIINLSTGYMIIVLVKEYIDIKVVGGYNTLQSVFSLILAFSGIIIGPWIVDLSHYYTERNHLFLKLLHKFMFKLIVILVAIGVIVFTFSEYAISIVYGDILDEFLGYIPYLYFINSLNAIKIFLFSTLIIYRRLNVIIICELINLSVVLIFGKYLIIGFGLNYLLAVLIITSLFQVAISYFNIKPIKES